jgi:hypothetical protein
MPPPDRTRGARSHDTGNRSRASLTALGAADPGVGKDGHHIPPVPLSDGFKLTLLVLGLFVFWATDSAVATGSATAGFLYGSSIPI